MQVNKNSVVLPNKRQQHLPEQQKIVHRSTEFVRDSDGRLVYDDKGRMKVISHTLDLTSRRPSATTPKERAKKTKAMMEARRRAEMK